MYLYNTVDASSLNALGQVFKLFLTGSALVHDAAISSAGVVWMRWVDQGIMSTVRGAAAKQAHSVNETAQLRNGLRSYPGQFIGAGDVLTRFN